MLWLLVAGSLGSSKTGHNRLPEFDYTMIASSGLVYNSVTIYRMVMRLLYRGDYDRKYQVVADLIPPGSSVVDLCAGDCVLARKISGKGCRYIGLELNPRFVRWARRAGIDARVFDVRTDEIPDADVICMQSSLYHFMSDEESLLERMVKRARDRVIISEPVVNLASSSNSLLSRMAIRATSVNGKEFPLRHSLESLTRMMDRLSPRGELVLRQRREAIFIILKKTFSPHPHDIPGTTLLQRRSSPEAECRARDADARASGAAL